MRLRFGGAACMRVVRVPARRAQNVWFCSLRARRHMWSHPATGSSLQRLTEWGCVVVQPAEKLLVCGDTGRGAMAPVADIVERLLLLLLAAAAAAAAADDSASSSVQTKKESQL